ncbi:M2 family metallopeptidase [Pseudohalioglobus sediminis]|uniref:M2 family metallopeptidase n=1 Tax=Pseudohalioglobus sediminis TaxID=2606449 RepID=A0A5B0WTW3_9GAMM|nr:M2 family metallopeptidase [Pseudohalioglobus sediminis]KAA1190524.1 M2 family metallopeptidase [Pseudohalioglobus sediminis]
MYLFRTALAVVTLSAGAPLALAANQHEAEARAFFLEARDEATAVALPAARARWIFNTYITHDTQQMVIETGKQRELTRVAQARQAHALLGKPGLSDSTRRDLNKVRQTANLPSPADPAATARLLEIGAELKNLYATGSYCDNNGECLSLREMERILRSSRDPAEQLALWQGWREVSPPMRQLYREQVELANAGASDLGFDDLGDYWRSRYDMSGDDFAAAIERYWQQAKPLYEALQCHVQARLTEYYGAENTPGDGTIPAHLTGNMWAQNWSGIEDIVMGSQTAAPFDLTAILAEREMDAIDIVKMAEGFFVSLGLEPLPDTFWERSMFTRPADREVVCHASAWNVDMQDDLRIKMCIQLTEDEVKVVHHELGHNYYQRAYKDLNYFHRGAANPGFHEALGDAIALSINGTYLHQIGLLDSAPKADKQTQIAALMKMALDKVAFLPFALVVDKWRWQVFSGEVGGEEYNSAWWQLRRQYQGVSAPVARSEANFDPGAKYHIPGNTSYSRYFLAHLLQFQFHERLCELAGFAGPLHQCSIYGSQAAGDTLNKMLAAGTSRPWQDTLEAFTGERDVDPRAMLNYFAPLKTWLDEQNKGRQCGWQQAATARPSPGP